MTENFITINNTAPIVDEYAQEKDKKKAYQIFGFSLLASIGLTIGMYFLALLI